MFSVSFTRWYFCFLQDETDGISFITKISVGMGKPWGNLLISLPWDLNSEICQGISDKNPIVEILCFCIICLFFQRFCTLIHYNLLEGFANWFDTTLNPGKKLLITRTRWTWHIRLRICLFHASIFGIVVHGRCCISHCFYFLVIVRVVCFLIFIFWSWAHISW